MTPRQLRDLTAICYRLEEAFDTDAQATYDIDDLLKRGRKAIAAGWRDYRAARIERRRMGPLKLLQRVKLDKSA